MENSQTLHEKLPAVEINGSSEVKKRLEALLCCWLLQVDGLGSHLPCCCCLGGHPPLSSLLMLMQPLCLTLCLPPTNGCQEVLWVKRAPPPLSSLHTLWWPGSGSSSRHRSMQKTKYSLPVSLMLMSPRLPLNLSPCLLAFYSFCWRATKAPSLLSFHL